MAYQVRYTFNVDWVGPGAGPMVGFTAPHVQGGGGSAQTKGFVGNPASTPIANGAGAGGTLTGGDVTNLTNAVAADMAAQINAALGTINNWPQGQP